METRLAATAEEAVAAAEAIGYPVVIKLNSETITHKTDVGGVRLNLRMGTTYAGLTRLWPRPWPNGPARPIFRA